MQLKYRLIIRLTDSDLESLTVHTYKDIFDLNNFCNDRLFMNQDFYKIFTRTVKRLVCLQIFPTLDR